MTSRNMKNLMHKEMHFPSRHQIALRMDHVIHQENFWATVLAIILIGIFVGIVIWAALSGDVGTTEIMPRPYYPFSF